MTFVVLQFAFNGNMGSQVMIYDKDQVMDNSEYFLGFEVNWK